MLKIGDKVIISLDGNPPIKTIVVGAEQNVGGRAYIVIYPNGWRVKDIEVHKKSYGMICFYKTYRWCVDVDIKLICPICLNSR